MWEFQVALEMDLVHIFQHIYVLWLHRPIINKQILGMIVLLLTGFHYLSLKICTD